MSQKASYFPLAGGLDLVSPRIAASPGSVVDAKNFEPGPLGYRRIQGFERIDGKQSPSSYTWQPLSFTDARDSEPDVPQPWGYYVLPFENGEEEPAASQFIYGRTSGCSAKVKGYELSSGSWADGDAAGVLLLDHWSGAPPRVSFSEYTNLATWGPNDHGQIGNGKESPIAEGAPVLVDPEGKTWSKVVSVGDMRIALDTTGQLYASGVLGWPVQYYDTDTTWTQWSYWPFYTNSTGLLLSESEIRNTFTEVDPTQTYTSFDAIISSYEVAGSRTARVFHAMFVKSDGTLWAVGDNSKGQLGDGTVVTRSSPVQIGALTTWSGVYCGQRCSLAIKADGTLWSWGEGTNGQLGSTAVADRSSPVQVGASTDWSALAVGRRFSVCGLTTSNTLLAWGLNSYGQLGQSNTTSRSSPVSVGSDTDWSSIHATDYGFVALKNTGAAQAWGLNIWGQLGDGTVANRSSPVAIGSGWADFAVVDETDIGEVFGVKTTGEIYRTGKGDRSSLAQLGTRGDLIAIYGGSAPTGVVSGVSQVDGSDGDFVDGEEILYGETLYRWGAGASWDTFGSVGDGQAVKRSSPVQVGSVSEKYGAPLSYGMGLTTTFLKHMDGTLWGFGSNAYGQLGLGDVANRSAPTQVGAGTDWKYIETFGNSTALIDSTGRLFTVGDNQYGQLGNGDTTNRSSPVQVGNSVGWVKAAPATESMVALRDDGTLWAWGRNHVGQLGDGTTTDRSSPVQIGSGTDWTDVLAGTSITMAIDSSGVLYASGEVSSGCFGVPFGADTSSPVQIGSVPTPYSKITSSGSNVFGALKQDGTVWVQGVNTFGVLGQNDTSTRSSPVQVGSRTDWVDFDIASTLILIDGSGRMYTCGRGTSSPHNDTVNRSSPVQVGTRTDWVRASPQGATRSVRLGDTTGSAIFRGALTRTNDQAWMGES